MIISIAITGTTKEVRATIGFVVDRNGIRKLNSNQN